MLIAKALIVLAALKREGFLAAGKDQHTPEKPGSVCFNNCSGHGVCRDFACECDIGYEGEDCRFCFAEDAKNIIQILGAGHLNLTSANFAYTLRETGALVVAVSARSCHKCIAFEPEYEAAKTALEKIGARLGRIDADTQRVFLRTILGEEIAAAQQLPILALFTPERPSRGLLLEGPHEQHAVVEFARKQLEPPTRRLMSVDEVDAFVRKPYFMSVDTGTPTVVVVGFFSHVGVMEEDEMEDFVEAAAALKPKCDVYFGVVDDAAVSEHFKQRKWITGTPEAYLARLGMPRVPSLRLRELLQNNASIKDWVTQKSLPLVGLLSNANFAQYERTGLPMLIMFLELSGEPPRTPRRPLRGKSGGVPNDDLLRELEEVALEHRNRISCLYADGIAFADSMKTLGLFGSRERLPQIGFNTKDGRQLPFPEDLPINRQTLLQFCSAFLSGRLQRAEDALKAMVSAAPFSGRNTVHRQKKRESPREVRGVSAQLKPQDALVQVTRDTFKLEAFNEEKDVILFFYSKECESCSHLAPYYKRVGERFQDLRTSSVTVAAMDVTDESPPPELGITLPSLPAIILLPADDKGPPFRFFSGIGKVGPIMRWFQTHASIGFDLPVLPHLSEAEKPIFREQVMRRQEAQAMAT